MRSKKIITVLKLVKVSQMALNLTIISLIIFVINIPFGYWRSNVKKFSLQWLLAVHIPIPFIVLLRIYSDIGFIWYTYPFLLGSFFIGQSTGSYIRVILKRHCKETTSFLLTDLIRCYKSSFR